MEANLIALAKACPDAIISVKVSDLIEANEALVARTKEQLEQLITDQSVESYPSREKVAELLNVDLSTLWRWAKRGLLVPIEIGGRRRYRMSDVRRMLNNGRQHNESKKSGRSRPNAEQRYERIATSPTEKHGSSNDEGGPAIHGERNQSDCRFQ